MKEIALQTVLGLVLLVISWKSTAFKNHHFWHFAVAVLVIGVAIFNGCNLNIKNSEITTLSDQLVSVRKENADLKQGQHVLNAKIDTLSNRFTPIEDYLTFAYPGKDIDEALGMMRAYIESTSQRVTTIEDGSKQRIITAEQERILIDSLFLIKELSKIYISYDASDLESRNYGSQFYSAINKVDLDIDTWLINHMETSHPKGIIILSKSAESDILQDKISKVFFKANINHKCERGNINDDFDINIKIGPN